MLSREQLVEYVDELEKEIVELKRNLSIARSWVQMNLTPTSDTIYSEEIK